MYEVNQVSSGDIEFGSSLEIDKGSAKLSRKGTTGILVELSLGSKSQSPDKTFAKTPMGSSRKLAKKRSFIFSSIGKIIGTVLDLKLPNEITAKAANLQK